MVDDAPAHLEKLRYVGFNVLRVPVVWEALEHAGPGIYDDEYIDNITKLVRICVDFGFKVVINPHQDLWSRFVGGSGAPLWTLHCCGLDPNYFADTHAAVRYAEWPLDSDKKDPKTIPSMMWTTNHNRLASATLFTLFFAGRDFAPKCQIGGMNIQDYLQQHYFTAYGRLAEALGNLPFGYDAMNEPEPGYIGWKDLSKNERDDTAKIGSTPSPIQSMRLGMGLSQEVDDYKLGSTGPRKTGSMTITPRRTCWLKEEDPRWNWDRASSWPLNTCVWGLHGVWNMETGELSNPQYFDRLPKRSHAASKSENDSETRLSFLSSYWQEFYQRWTETIRKHSPHSISFVQPSVYAAPPPREDPLTAYSPHFYDPLTMMQGRWNDHWNVDVVGLFRGRYKVKALGLRVGKGHVKKLISDEIGQLAHDLKVPTLIGETGIPFTLENSKAYSSGDYTDHVKALDATLSGCDDHLVGFTIWAYSVINNHEWGDHWNGEDLSLYCPETGTFPNHKYLENFRAAAAWCRPYVQSLTGEPLSMTFDYSSSKFTLEISSETGGYATVYVPWLHYRESDESENLALVVELSVGEWLVDGQHLRWSYEHGGKLELQRAGGPLSPQQLGTIIK